MTSQRFAHLRTVAQSFRMPDRFYMARAEDVGIIGTSGEYSGERLYILETIRRLERKADEQTEKAGATGAVLAKLRTDLNEAHSRVRTLTTVKDQIEQRVMRMEIKSAYIAAASGSVVAAGIEVARLLLGK
jgi:hypothetical protein